MSYLCLVIICWQEMTKYYKTGFGKYIVTLLLSKITGRSSWMQHLIVYNRSCNLLGFLPVYLFVRHGIPDTLQRLTDDQLKDYVLKGDT